MLVSSGRSEIGDPMTLRMVPQRLWYFSARGVVGPPLSGALAGDPTGEKALTTCLRMGFASAAPRCSAASPGSGAGDGAAS